MKVVAKQAHVSVRMNSSKCKQCGKSFQEKSAFVKHLKTHTKERPFKCVTCGKNFSKKSSLVIHQQTHTKGKPFTCKECAKTFAQKSSLLVHSKTHLPKKAKGSRNLGCDWECTKRVKKHTGEKPYKCLECKKTFVLYRNFTKHQKMHVSEMPRSPEPVQKMRENVDMLLLNQQSQLRVLQEIQKQLGVLLPGNDLINANVYSLGLLLGQQATSMGLSSFPLLNPSLLLPENARPFSSQVLSQSSLPEIFQTSLRLGSQCPAPKT